MIASMANPATTRGVFSIDRPPLLAVTSIILALLASALFVGSARVSHREVVRRDEDPISGEWSVLFLLEDTKTPRTFKLKLDGDKVSGTAESTHTGPGTLSNGSWVNNKLSFTLDFKAHESIAITGSLQDGKLSGEFSAEGMQGKWEAKKK